MEEKNIVMIIKDTKCGVISWLVCDAYLNMRLVRGTLNGSAHWWCKDNKGHIFESHNVSGDYRVTKPTLGECFNCGDSCTTVVCSDLCNAALVEAKPYLATFYPLSIS